MNYTLDEEDKNILQLLQDVKSAGGFDDATAVSNGYFFAIEFMHKNFYCSTRFDQHGTFYFRSSSPENVCNIKKQYCIHESYFFGLCKKSRLNANHPVIVASRDAYDFIMQRSREVDEQKKQKVWKQLLNS